MNPWDTKAFQSREDRPERRSLHAVTGLRVWAIDLNLQDDYDCVFGVAPRNENRFGGYFGMSPHFEEPHGEGRTFRIAGHGE